MLMFMVIIEALKYVSTPCGLSRRAVRAHGRALQMMMMLVFMSCARARWALDKPEADDEKSAI